MAYISDNARDFEDNPKFATIVTGESLFKIQQSGRLTECFIELALTTDVLIGCRLTEGQKSEIVQLLREYQPKSVILAVGDGINDIQMMKEADISINIATNNNLTK